MEQSHRSPYRPAVRVLEHRHKNAGALVRPKNGAAKVPAICSVVEIAISESATIRPEPSARVI
jgi:hypothetical protein